MQVYTFNAKTKNKKKTKKIKPNLIAQMQLDWA
jgi:hypothetical protein